MEVPSPTSHAAPLGIGWKARPCVRIESAQVFTVAEISGMGVVQHIWLTLAGNARFSILRIYWDGSEQPSVQCPVADFFANAWGEFAQVSSLAVCVNPNRGYNCYWEMPFRKQCRITIENLGAEALTLYYQVTFALTEVPNDAAYFHSQFRRSNPVPDKQVHTLLDGVRGTATTWARTLPGASTDRVGGARERSSSTWTATVSFRRSAAREPRTTSEAPGTSMRAATRRSPGPTAALHRSCAPTGSTSRRRASACTDGIWWIDTVRIRSSRDHSGPRVEARSFRL